MRDFGVTRYVGAGAALGTALAVCLHIWQVYATNQSGMSPEGVVFSVYFFSYLLGFPTSALVSMVAELPGWSGYFVLLAGIVVNWALLFLIMGLRRQQRALERPARARNLPG